MRDTWVTRTLDAAGVPYELRPHSKCVYTTEEAAHERGVRVEQIVKVMIARTSTDELVAVLIPGDKRLDLDKLRGVLRDKKAGLASQDEIERVTGFTIGAISPVGINRFMPVYMDRGVLREEMVAISSGSPDAGLLLRSADLLRLVGGALGDFAR